MLKKFPKGNPPQIINMFTDFDPDIAVTIKQETTTGRSVVEVTDPRTNLKKMVSPLLVEQILIVGLSANLQLMIQQNAMLIKTEPPKSHPFPSAEGHDFLACTDNEEICRLCGSHFGNHSVTTTKPNGEPSNG